MVIGLLAHIFLSCFTHFLFCTARVPLNLDVLGCFHKVDEEGNVVARKTRYLDGPVENLKVSFRKLKCINVKYLLISGFLVHTIQILEEV